MLNPYTYTTGDPVNHTDPTGQSPVSAWDWTQVALDVGFLALNAAALIATPTPLGGILKAAAVAGTLALGIDTLTVIDKYLDFLPEGSRKPIKYSGYALSGINAVGGVYGDIFLGAKAFGSFKMPALRSNAVSGSAEEGLMDTLAGCGVRGKCWAPAAALSSRLNGNFSAGFLESDIKGKFIFRSAFETGVGRGSAGPFSKLQFAEFLKTREEWSHGIMIGLRDEPLSRIVGFFDGGREVLHYLNVVNHPARSLALDGWMKTVKTVDEELSSMADKIYYMDIGAIPENLRGAIAWG